MKRFPLVVMAALAVALTACGDDGGGGSQDAFCNALEDLSDQVADGDLASDDGLEDVTDTVNDLLESAADGDQLDAVNQVGDDVQDAQPEDADDMAETIQDELGDFAEDCDIDEDEFAIQPTTTTTETTATTEEPATDTTAPPETDGGDGGATEIADVVVHGRDDVPGDIAAEFAELAQACFDGDASSCDTLFQQTPAGSVDEAYGATCGGRIDDADAQNFFGQCSNLITGPVAVPADVTDQATAAACEQGDMQACDDLFRNSASDSTDEAYGALCGGRVQNTDAFCIDIFGDTAFQ